MSPSLLFPQPRNDVKERLPLLPRPPRTYVSAAAKQYEERFVALEQAMKDTDAERVQKIVAELNALSMHIENEESLGACLEKGRFSWAARQRLRKEYLDRYVFLRGGGGNNYTNMDNADVWARGDTSGGKDEYLSAISDPEVRNGFIQKVYSLLSLQLLATVLIAALTMHLLDKYLKDNVGAGLLIFVISVIVLLVTGCSFACIPDLQKSFPINFIILGLMTLAMATLVGFTSFQYTGGSVLVVCMITAVVVVGLTGIAVFSGIDFTGFGPYLACALMVLIGMTFVSIGASMLGFDMGFTRLVLAAVTALLFSAYIVYDTQLIVGGKHENKFSVDDYVMATINLYLDIINLFLALLRLFGDRK